MSEGPRPRGDDPVMQQVVAALRKPWPEDHVLTIVDGIPTWAPGGGGANPIYLLCASNASAQPFIADGSGGFYTPIWTSFTNVSGFTEVGIATLGAGAFRIVVPEDGVYAVRWYGRATPTGTAPAGGADPPMGRLRARLHGISPANVVSGDVGPQSFIGMAWTFQDTTLEYTVTGASWISAGGGIDAVLYATDADGAALADVTAITDDFQFLTVVKIAG
jgi:hypothetical protein